MSNLIFDLWLGKRNGVPRPPWETAVLILFWLIVMAAGWWIGGRI